MAWGFATFEKLKEGVNNFVSFVWKICPLLAMIFTFKWWGGMWAPKKALDALDWLQAKMPQETHLNIQSVGVAWSRINQWVPVPEILTMAGIIVALIASRAVVKWGAKVF